jgi:hypothetical protein
MGKFSSAVDAWAMQTEQRLEAVVKTAAQDVASEMIRPVGAGGRMRVDTGFLRASLRSSTAAMPQIDQSSQPGLGGGFGDPDVALTILGAAMGQPIYLGFTASYAAHREYGANGQAPDGFVRGAAEQWTSLVSSAVRKVRGF